MFRFWNVFTIYSTFSLKIFLMLSYDFMVLPDFLSKSDDSLLHSQYVLLHRSSVLLHMQAFHQHNSRPMANSLKLAKIQKKSPVFWSVEMWTNLLKHWWKVIQVSLFLFWVKWISEKLIFWKVTIVFESAGAQSVTKLSPGLLTFTNKQSSTPRSLLQTDFIWSKDLPTEHISKLLYFLFHFYDLNLIAEVDDD